MTDVYVVCESEGARHAVRVSRQEDADSARDDAVDFSDLFDSVRAPNVYAVFTLEDGEVRERYCHNGWHWNFGEVKRLCPDAVRDKRAERYNVIIDGRLRQVTSKDFERWLMRHKALQDGKKGDHDV